MDKSSHKDFMELQSKLGTAYEIRKLKKAIDSLKASIVITDINGNIEFANPYFTQLTGYSPEEYLGKNPRVLKSDHHPVKYYQELWNTILSGQTWEGEFLNRKKNGELYWESAIISPVTNDLDELSHFVAIKTDITETKRLSNELLELKAKADESEVRYRTAFHTSPDAININKMDGTYVDINEGFTTLTGYSYDDVIGVTSTKLNIWANPEDRQRLRKGLLESGTVENLEAEFRLKNGSVKTALMSAKLVRINDETHILSITRDISDRKNIENEIKAAREIAEESNRIKTAFLQNMSHEIRTPLNGIVGFSQIIAEQNHSSEKLKMFAEMISESSEKLIGIVTDVMEMSQLQSNQVITEIREIDIQSLITDIVSGFEKRARCKNVELILSIDSTISSLIIKSDPEKLKRIISHVIDNALKFTLNGSVIVKCRMDNQNLIISIADTGIGIDSEQQKYIFEPFRQVETESHRNYGGNGLGLALARSYLELLNGSISLKSEVDRGTVVEILIPLY